MKPIIFSTPMVKAILDARKTQTRRVIKDVKLPRYAAGDILWVREAWCKNENPNSPNYGGYEYYADYEGAHCQSLIKWRSPIFMPREAARLFLKVKTVRVERLQDITAHDAIREGMESVIPFDTVDEFKELWDNLNAKRGYGWETNPWVLVIEFERINKE